MLCYSCGKQREKLHTVKSALLKGVDLFMCQVCIDSKFEPRYTIIMAGRQFGTEYVRDYIIKHRYVGRDISGSEIVA